MVRNISTRGMTAFATALMTGAGLFSASTVQAQTPATDPAAPIAPAADNTLLDDPVHIDELASYLQTVSNSLCWEMHRFHREQPEFTEAYRSAKEIWQMAGGLRDAVRTGPVDLELVQSRVNRMNDLMSNVEKITERWGDGLKQTAVPVQPRGVVVTPGAGVDLDLPFVGGFRVGAPRVYVPDDAPPVLDRQRIHPNARGSKRALERELFGTRVALNYLMEDMGVGGPVAGGPVEAARPVPNAKPAPKPSPSPEPAGPALAPPIKISPPAAKRGEPVKK